MSSILFKICSFCFIIFFFFYLYSKRLTTSRCQPLCGLVIILLRQPRFVVAIVIEALSLFLAHFATGVKVLVSFIPVAESGASRVQTWGDPHPFVFCHNFCPPYGFHAFLFFDRVHIYYSTFFTKCLYLFCSACFFRYFTISVGL